MTDSSNIAGSGQRLGEKEDPDSIRVPHQNYALVSFVAPKGARQKSKIFQLKLRGCFDTVEEANVHARLINELDPDFDIHIVRMGAWLPLPPPVEVYNEVPMTYNQPVLRDTMNGYYRQIAQNKADIERRIKEAKAKTKKVETH